MEFDYSTLNGRIIEKYGTQFNFAIAMNMSERSLSLKLNNKVSWRNTDMFKAIELLSIPKREIHQYFFKPKVQ
ncbi:DUF739 family protein [Macrococcus capreoli]|uniref:DUF739 family protein n=1 Tax=Macrococcus capreoli TaxID=2982690 RepID=UPI003EE4F2D2